jgi:hypothetical protein
MATFAINDRYDTVGNMFAALAQLVEQRFCKAKVLGPSPRGGSRIKVTRNITTCLFYIFLRSL